MIVLSDINYKSLLNFHNENKADLTIAIRKYSNRKSVWRNKYERDTCEFIYEKPIKDIIINAGIYVMNSRLIKELTYNKSMNMNELIMQMIKKRKSNCFPFYENWFDLGTKQQIKIFRDNF